MKKTFSKYLLSLTILLLGIVNSYANASNEYKDVFQKICQELNTEANIQNVHFAYFKSSPLDSGEHHKESKERVTEEEVEESISSSKKSNDISDQHLATLLSVFLLDYYHLEQLNKSFPAYERFSYFKNHTPLYITLCDYRL